MHREKDGNGRQVRKVEQRALETKRWPGLVHSDILNQAILTSGEHLAMSGDISGCHNLGDGGSTTGF